MIPPRTPRRSRSVLPPLPSLRRRIYSGAATGMHPRWIYPPARRWRTLGTCSSAVCFVSTCRRLIDLSLIAGTDHSMLPPGLRRLRMLSHGCRGSSRRPGSTDRSQRATSGTVTSRLTSRLTTTRRQTTTTCTQATTRSARQHIYIYSIYIYTFSRSWITYRAPKRRRECPVARGQFSNGANPDFLLKNPDFIVQPS